MSHFVQRRHLFGFTIRESAIDPSSCSQVVCRWASKCVEDPSIAVLWGRYVHFEHVQHGVQAQIEAVTELEIPMSEALALPKEELVQLVPSGEMTAEQMGLVPVGLAFATPPVPYLGMDSQQAVLASRFQSVPSGAPFSRWVTCLVRPESFTPNAPIEPSMWMLSDQGVALLRDGVFDDTVCHHPGQTLCTVRKSQGAQDWVPELTMAIDQEGRRTIQQLDAVETVALMVRISIGKSLNEGMFKHCDFQLRMSSPDPCEAIRDALRRRATSEPLQEQLSDFELMIRLRDVPGIHECLPQLIDAVCDRSSISCEIEASFRRMIGLSVIPNCAEPRQQVGQVSLGPASFSFI